MNIKKISKKKISLDDGEKFIYMTNALSFDDMQSIRTELQYFMKSYIDNRKIIDNVLLTVSEILTNLIKHSKPEVEQLRITLFISHEAVEIDVADSSETFNTFEDKIKTDSKDVALGDESGFGLTLISKMNDVVEYIGKGSSKDELNHFMAKKLINKKDDENGHTKKIFLIDDEPIALQIHANMLNDIYDVITFDNAEKALSAFNFHKPDLIISDLVMPDTCGMELRRKLSRLEGGDSVPFVFLSGNQYEEDSMYISRLGIDDFLSKPISEEKLKNVVARLLRRSQQVRDAIHGQFSRDITEILKPTVPENHNGWKFFIKYQVADAGGGDFVLYKMQDDNMIGVLADIMGHGQQAKFFTYTYAGYMRSMFRNRHEINNGEKFMDCLSKCIGEDELLENIVMTCLYFQLFNDGKVNIVSAGHPKPIIIRKGMKDIRTVPVTGPLPGLTIDNLYNNVTEQLQPGDRIMFATDGFIDVFEQTGMGSEAFIDAVKQTFNPEDTNFEDFIWKSFVARQATSSFDRDDATIIIAEYGE